MDVREPDFEGSWYPRGERACRGEIESFLKKPLMVQSTEVKRVGGIVPHAGWTFSGKLACNVIHSLKGEEKADTMVIFGSHLSPESHHHMMMEGLWHTPFGDLEIDTPLAKDLTDHFRFDIETTRRHHRDNTIELQLPFVSYFFPQTKILPIGVAPGQDCIKMGQKVVKLAKSRGLNIKILGSTDLTHYGPNYGFLPAGRGRDALKWVKEENDRRIVDLMVKMDPKEILEEALEHHNACCPGSAAAAVAAAKEMGALKGECLDYYTSHDVYPNDSFVGYVGVVF